MIFGLAPKSSTEPAGGNAVAMAYIVTKQNRFYVVTYDGIDPTTGRERRRWHLAGDSREDAETIAANLTRPDRPSPRGARSAATVTSFVSEVWMPKRVQHLRPSTAHRYRWMIDNYITPTIGHLPIRSLRAEHLERLYADLLATGKINGTGLAPKTVYDVHVIMRAALKHAVRIHLVEHNVALDATAPRPTAQAKQGPESWTFDQLRTFLAATRHLRLYPALHLAATTGMRRGELAGLRWSDWNQHHPFDLGRPRPTIRRRTQHRGSLQDQEQSTMHRPRPAHRNHPRPTGGAASNATGTRSDSTMRSSRTPKALPVHPESISQLFTRQLARIDLPTIRFHDLRHTHAITARRVEYADQGRVRTARPRPSRLHDGHLPTRHARHGRLRRPHVRPDADDAA